MTFEEKTISSEMIYKGTILNLRKDKVTVSGGGYSYREIVEHNGGAVAVAVTDDKEVILVRQFRKPMERVMTELPAGKIEPGEDPLATIKRELKEETGYSASNIKLMAEFHPSVGYTSETLYIYLATGLIEGEAEPDEHEALDIIKMPLKDAIDMVVKGEITDGKTMAGLLLTKYFI